MREDGCGVESLTSESSEPATARTASSIRRATRADVPAITDLINLAYRVEEFFVEGDRTTSGEVAESLADGAFYLTGDDTGLLGCVYVEVRGRLGYLGLLAVSPGVQSRGLGRALVEVAEDHCRQAGCTRMELLVVNLRRELPPWYKRLGYEEVGTKPFDEAARLKQACHFIVMTKAL